jgi:hypothetical protein
MLSVAAVSSTTASAERATSEWHHANARTTITRWDAEIAGLERELATIPRHLREQGAGFHLWTRVLTTRWGTRLLFGFSRAVLWLAQCFLGRQSRG